MMGMNSGLHRLSTIRSEVNKSANDEALKFSFIVPTSGTFKDSWLRNAIHHAFYAYLNLGCSPTSFIPTHNVIDLSFCSFSLILT